MLTQNSSMQGVLFVSFYRQQTQYHIELLSRLAIIQTLGNMEAATTRKEGHLVIQYTMCTISKTTICLESFHCLVGEFPSKLCVIWLNLLLYTINMLIKTLSTYKYHSEWETAGKFNYVVVVLSYVQIFICIDLQGAFKPQPLLNLNIVEQLKQFIIFFKKTSRSSDLILKNPNTQQGLQKSLEIFLDNNVLNGPTSFQGRNYIEYLQVS